MVDIRPFDLENVAIHYKWNNDKELNFYDSEYPYRHESFESFLKRIKSVVDRSNETAELFEVRLPETDKLIGVVDIFAIDKYNRRCFVNCTIGDRTYANQGYDVEALKAILAYCFDQKDMHKVATTAFDFNTSWIEKVQKLGFKQEGTLREHVLKRRKFRDKLIFSILKDEYKASVSSKSTVAAG